MKMPGNRAETICILEKIVNSHFNAFHFGEISRNLIQFLIEQGSHFLKIRMSNGTS